MAQDDHQPQQVEIERDALAVANRRARRRLRVMVGLLAASSLVATVAIHSALSASRMAYQGQQDYQLALQRLEADLQLARQASRISLMPPNQPELAREVMSLEDQGWDVVRQSAQYPDQVQSLVEAL